jgi:hypothetical protein
VTTSSSVSSFLFSFSAPRARDRFPDRERDDLVAQLEEAENNNAGT